jgi:uncharacterized protein (DUF2235 family)
MGKKIVLCFDGTGNSFQNPNEDSNVVKLYSSLVINEGQRGYYHPGVGTMGDPNSGGIIGGRLSKFRGLAFGKGLLANVGDAYQYLMNTYADGDEIYLFGFSRGAFTARAFASIIHVYGLLCEGNQGCIPYILDMYARESRKAQHNQRTFKPDRVFQWQFSHTRSVKIHFCGLWDTVSSYGWVYDPIQLPFLGNNPIIKIGRHAISIDERRCYYQDNLWGEAQRDQDIRQVWFRGVHSDVGGSYPESQSGLSKIALEWMLVEAEKAGLAIDQYKAETVLGRAAHGYLPKYVPPDKNGPVHKSLSGWWWAFEFLPHQDPHKGKGWYIPLGRRRTIPQDAIIHESAVGSTSFPKDGNHPIEPWVPYTTRRSYSASPLGTSA